MKARIHHTILSVSNFQKSSKFYDKLMKAMGYEIGLDHQDENYCIRAYVQDGSGLYIQYEAAQEYKKFQRFPGLNHICFKVDSKQDVDNLYSIVKELETEITREPKVYPEYTKNYYAFFFRDPDGVPLEIAVI